MDPVTAGIAVVVIALLAFVGLAVGLWVLRKTLTLIKRLVMFAAVVVLIGLVAVGVYVGMVIGG